MDDAIEPTPEQLLAALDATELVESVGALTVAQRGDLLERMALLVGANRSVSVEEFRSELTDILDSGPTFHAVLHGGQFDGQVMELDPEDFDADVICAAVDGDAVTADDIATDDTVTADDAVQADAHAGEAGRASETLHSLYHRRDGEPAPGATVHYQFGGLIAADASEPRPARTS